MALTEPQARFVTGVSQRTGIDPRVLVAWVQAEGADAPGGTGHFNYLNLRPYQGDPYASVSPGGFEQFASVDAAVEATTRRLTQPFAAPIVAAARAQAPPAAEIAAIASTGWDSGHYGGAGGPNLARIFASIFTPAALTGPYLGSGNAAAVAATASTGSAADAGSFDVTGSGGGPSAGEIAGHIPGVKQAEGLVHGVESVGALIGKITSKNFLYRAGEVILGGVLTLMGLYLLARQVGLRAPIPPGPAGVVTRNVPAVLASGPEA